MYLRLTSTAYICDEEIKNECEEHATILKSSEEV